MIMTMKKINGFDVLLFVHLRFNILIQFKTYFTMLYHSILPIGLRTDVLFLILFIVEIREHSHLFILSFLFIILSIPRIISPFIIFVVSSKAYNDVIEYDESVVKSLWKYTSHSRQISSRGFHIYLKVFFLRQYDEN